MKTKPAIVFDLDGTVRQSKSGEIFIRDHNDVALLPGIKEAIARYREVGYLILGASNQGGIAHGFKTEDGFRDELHVMSAMLGIESKFDFIMFCPFMETGAKDGNIYNRRSLLRKPQPGMLAVLEYHCWSNLKVCVDWNKSFFVGDRKEDEECAHAAGITFVHINNFFNYKNKK